MRKTAGFLLAIGLIFSFAVPSRAQSPLPILGYEHGVGVRAIGMGGAFVGLADDYAATYWNPAGLGQIRRMELTGALSSLRYRNETIYYGNGSLGETSATRFQTLGFVFPIPTYRGSLVFSIGYHKVGSFHRNFYIEGFLPTPGDSVQQNAEQLDDGDMAQWSFGGSVQVSEFLYLGGSINLWTGTYDYSWDLVEKDVLDIWEQFSWVYRDHITTRISGANLTLAALYNRFNRIRLGVAIETPVSFKGTENWETYTYEDYDDNTYWDTTRTGEYTYRIQRPIVFNVGASFRLPLITLAGSAAFIDWTQMKYTSGGNLQNENRFFRRNLRAVIRYRMGAEVLIPLLNLRLRAGYVIDPSPHKGQIGYSDKQFVTAGVGLLLDRQFTLDVAVIRGWWKYVGPEAYTEDIKVMHYFISGSFRF